MEEYGMKHHQKVYILFWLHFYSHLSFLSKLIVTMYMLLFLNTSCTSLFEIWNVLSANLTPQVENSTADLMRWNSKEQKLTKLPLDCVSEEHRQKCLCWDLGPIPRKSIHIYVYICTHMCVNAYVHIYIHMYQHSKTHYLNSGFFCCDEILWLKATWEGKGLFCPSSWEGLQGRNGGAAGSVAGSYGEVLLTY